MDFVAMFETWKNVLTQPGEEVFEAERENSEVSLSTAMMWIGIAAAISAVFGAISTMISSLFRLGGDLGSLMEMLPPEVAQQYGPILNSGGVGVGGGLVGAISTFCFTLFFAPIFFLISSLIYFAIAKIFGGSGEFEEQTYFLATFGAPMMIINSALGLVPFVGGCIGFIVWIYQLVLSYYAIKVSHQLSSGAAIGVILTPIILGLLLFGCCMALIVALVISTGGLPQ